MHINTYRYEIQNCSEDMTNWEKLRLGTLKAYEISVFFHQKDGLSMLQ